MIQKIHDRTQELASQCGCMAATDYDMKQIWDADEDIRSLKSLILFVIVVKSPSMIRRSVSGSFGHPLQVFAKAIMAPVN